MREMFVDNNVILLRQPDMTMEGHNNPPTFDDDIAAVLAQGTMRVAWDRVKVAIHDPRLLRQHLKVLIELLDCMNSRAGTAWPSRETLAERCGLNVRTIQNALYDLRKLNYIAWQKRTVEGKRLTHYTTPLGVADHDYLRAQLDAYLHSLTGNKTAQPAVQKVTQPVMHTQPAVQKPAQPAVQKTTLPAVQQEVLLGPVRGKIDSRRSAKAEGVVRKVVRKATDAVRGSRLSEDWVLSAKLGNWALEQFEVTPNQVRAEAQRFKDHWLAKAGKEARKVDWEATWRNWCGSEIRKWKRRKAMTTKIAPDLLAVVQQQPTELERELEQVRKQDAERRARIARGEE